MSQYAGVNVRCDRLLGYECKNFILSDNMQSQVKYYVITFSATYDAKFKALMEVGRKNT